MRAAMPSATSACTDGDWRALYEPQSTITRAGSCSAASELHTPRTASSEWLGPPVPPCSTTWQSRLPDVSTMPATPCLETLRKACGPALALTASMAAPLSPLLPFLKPTGVDSPLDSSQCNGLSTVLASFPLQLTRSAMNCGEIVSRYSVLVGRPSRLMSSSSCRACRKPLLIWQLPSRSGSLIRPFQPAAEAEVSKLTFMTTTSSSAHNCAAVRRRAANSIAARGSCTVEGPTTTTSLSRPP
mmetsp:Transcript_4375/g.10857  ORF Transcript_4375/g.10857 Transcript_4375/m.10857 type:complete len:243 (+) Transcript_4375:336-1064(+)